MKRSKIIFYASLLILLVYPVYLAGKHLGTFIVNVESLKYVVIVILLIYPLYFIGKKTGIKIVKLLKN